MGPPVIDNTSATAAMAGSAQAKPTNAAEAAKQFEALLIGQMMRTARESASEGSLDEDSTSDSMFDLAGQHFAQMIADHGGFGLAKLITQGLTKK